MKAELGMLAISLVVGMSTCSFSVWSFDKASPEERVAFIGKEALKLAGKASIRQQDFARIVQVNPHGNARSVDVQVLLPAGLSGAGNGQSRDERLRKACADYVRTPLKKNDVEVGVVLRTARGVLSTSDMQNPQKVIGNSSAVASFKLTPDACERVLAAGN
ncbi:MAG: hypothetical protein R3C13_11675 [Hyphomonas sp.]|uniref:hypothetical protein n=1 Tax=Hyphomonas sp. TaxID=87 RepID=UPI003527DA9C